MNSKDLVPITEKDFENCLNFFVFVEQSILNCKQWELLLDYNELSQ